MADAKVLFDVVCDHVLQHFTLKILKHLQRKQLAWRSWQMISMFLKFNQPYLDHYYFPVCNDRC